MRAGIAPNAATAYGYGDRPARRRSTPARRSSIPGAPRSKPPVQVINFRKVVSGALRGFCDIRLNAACLDGKKQYRAMVEWRDRDRSDRFSERVIGLLLKKHPDALDGDLAL